jgi:hypothetical protein
MRDGGGHLSRTKEGKVEATRAPTPPVVSLGLLRMLADDRWGQRDSPGAMRLNPAWLTEGSRSSAKQPKHRRAIVHDIRVPRVSDTREVGLIGLRAHGNSDGPEMRLDGP